VAFAICRERVVTTTYNYDNDGNLTAAGTSTFSWDYQTIDTANGGKFNAGALFSDAPTNALFGAIPGLDAIPGTSLVVRDGLFPVVKTLYTKLARGTISGVSNSSLAKFFGAALLQQGPGAATQSMTKMLSQQWAGGGAGNSQSGRSAQSAGGGGNTVSTWMGALNPFQPH
jgi:hypothetical protein